MSTPERAELDDLLRGVLGADRRALARCLRLVDDDATAARHIAAALHTERGAALVLGVTGNPGAGKSTLVDQLIAAYRKQDKRVAVLAVDPSSPFSGGAILGDRIRMSRHHADDGVFIRSLATRGNLGGLSRSTFDSVRVLEAARYDVILIETVGVGQDEVDVARLADTTLVVLVPGLGDDVQAIKAGLLEIADIFVINKADREGAADLERGLRHMLSLAPLEGAWEPPIVRTVAPRGEGLDELVATVARHGEFLAGDLGRRRRQVREREVFEKLLDAALVDNGRRKLGSRATDAALRVEAGADPYAELVALVDAEG